MSDKIVSIKVAFYKGSEEFLDKVIQWWTKSPYSHCEIVIDGVSYTSSPRDGGVRGRIINWKPEHWDFIEVHPDVQPTPEQVRQWFFDHWGQKYDWLGLIGFVFPKGLRFNSQKRWFCSEACATALGLSNPSSFTPQGLYDELVWRNPHRVRASQVGLIVTP